MYILSKIIEFIVGRNIYNSDFQEPILTSRTLELTLKDIAQYSSLSIKQQMALALGRGVAFLENQISIHNDSEEATERVEYTTYKYTENAFAIDDRDILLDKILAANDQNINISMCAILDDTSESVIDLLWIQQLVEKNKNLKVHLLLNTAQISINFSSSMLDLILSSPYFKSMNSMLNTQIFRHSTYCPLISYQNNFISQDAWKVIKDSDFVYVKGMNFFETCQNLGKDTFYAFIVYGPISSLYTGLSNYDAVYAFVPQSSPGYVHNKDHKKITTLTDIITSRKS